MRVDSCTNCGGRVEFSPSDKSLKCVNCGSLYSIEYRQMVDKYPVQDVAKIEDLDNFSTQTRSYKCDICGALVTFSRYDIAGNCQYCHNPSMTPLKDLPGLRPDKIIPFKIGKEQAKNEFETRTLKRKFLPSDFKKDLPRMDIGATYISAFTFDAFVTARYRARESYTETETDSQGRSTSVTRYRTITGNIEHDFRNLVVENSDKINQEEVRGILPYDFNECYDYNNDFIKGFNVGYYNQDVNRCESVARSEMVEVLKHKINNKHGGVDSIEVFPTYHNIRFNYTLLPAYFVNFNYKNKPYINMMNGQTGKVTGKVPRSKAKITLLVLFILLAIGLPTLFILLSML